MPAAGGPRRVRVGAWDAAVFLWVAACLGLAVVTGVEVERLTDVSDTLVASSHALDTTAAAMNRLRDVPIIGQDVGDVANEISHTADSARASASSSRDTIGRVAILLSLSIFVIAVVPPVVAYVAIRHRLTGRAGPDGRVGPDGRARSDERAGPE